MATRQINFQWGTRRALLPYLACSCLYQGEITGALDPLILKPQRFNVTSRLAVLSTSSLLLTSGLAQIQTGWLFAFTGNENPSSPIHVIFSRRIQLLEKMTVLKNEGGGEGQSPRHVLTLTLSRGEWDYHTKFKCHRLTVLIKLISYLDRLLPWPQKHTWTVWMPANNLSPTPPFHNSLQPLTFKLFSCPLLPPVFVFLFMISIWLGHVLQIVHSVIRSVVFSSRSLFGVYFPFNSSFPNASFLGLIVCCFVFFPFPPVLFLPSLLLSLSVLHGVTVF